MTNITKIGNSFDLRLPFEVKPDHVVELPRGNKALIYNAKLTKQRRKGWDIDAHAYITEDYEIPAWRVKIDGPDSEDFQVQHYDEQFEVNERVIDVARKLHTKACKGDEPTALVKRGSGVFSKA